MEGVPSVTSQPLTVGRSTFVGAHPVSAKPADTLHVISRADMKVTWEMKDLMPGRRLGKPGREEVWMIGYVAATPQSSLTSLKDGMVIIFEGKEELLKRLNSSGDIPIELFGPETPK